MCRRTPAPWPRQPRASRLPASDNLSPAVIRACPPLFSVVKKLHAACSREILPPCRAEREKKKASSFDGPDGFSWYLLQAEFANHSRIIVLGPFRYSASARVKRDRSPHGRACALPTICRAHLSPRGVRSRPSMWLVSVRKLLGDREPRQDFVFCQTASPTIPVTRTSICDLMHCRAYRTEAKNNASNADERPWGSFQPNQCAGLTADMGTVQRPQMIPTVNVATTSLEKSMSNGSF